MTSTPPTSQPKCDTGSMFTTAPSAEHSYEDPQVCNTSGPELDLRNRPHPELAYQKRSNRGLQHEAAPPQKDKTRPRSLRRSTILLSIALCAAIISTAVVGGIVGSLVKREKGNANTDSKDASVISNDTVVLSGTTVFAQKSASRTTTLSSSSTSTDYSSSSASSSSSSSSSDGVSPTIVLEPSETYSIQSSPTLTLSRDCPGSNGTTIFTNDIPRQSFIKNCNWVYDKPKPIADTFQTMTSTLDACISLCAAYNVLNGTGPFAYCTAVEWHWDLGESLAGHCFGNWDSEAGKGEPALGGKNAPADAAFFLGWSE